MLYDLRGRGPLRLALEITHILKGGGGRYYMTFPLLREP